MKGKTLSLFEKEREALAEVVPARISGRVTRIVGLVAESHGLAAPIGSQCEIVGRRGERLSAEVVGFREENTVVVPYGDIRGIAAGDRIYFRGDVPRVWVGRDLIGRVVNSSGELIDRDLSSRVADEVEGIRERRMPVHGEPVNPMLRQRIREPLATGVRVIDTLFTTGKGQRLGIFSGSGVGKSVLLSMIARNTSADVSVIALIGERGREVLEFIERDLGRDGLERSIVVVATSDEPALRRVQAALIATSIAEFFRDRGLEVMLMMDSVTRVAMAQREIGLSAGEPPATKGYPPSVFAMLPRLLERSGPGVRGNITAFYTVLVEGDDVHDPVGDAVRGILDGHLWLSRELASRSFFPSVDPLQSISRSMPDVVSPSHFDASRRAIELIARYRGIEDLIQLGAYTSGADPKVDQAVRTMPKIEELLRQDRQSNTAFEDAVRQLEETVGTEVSQQEEFVNSGAASGTMR